jgi:hypothetical protein
MSLPRFLVTTSWVLCGFLLATHLQSWGAVWVIIGFLTGGTVAFIITWFLLLGRLLLFFPLPICRNGKCSRFGKDYVWKKGTIYGWEKWGKYRYKCKCGDQYVRQATKFMIVASDGSIHPYKKLVGFRHWEDDGEK